MALKTIAITAPLLAELAGRYASIDAEFGR